MAEGMTVAPGPGEDSGPLDSDLPSFEPWKLSRAQGSVHQDPCALYCARCTEVLLSISAKQGTWTLDFNFIYYQTFDDSGAAEETGAGPAPWSPMGSLPCRRTALRTRASGGSMKA